MKKGILHLVFLASLVFFHSAHAKDPVQEFVTSINSQTQKLGEVLALYLSGEQQEKVAMDTLISGTGTLLKKLAKTPLKELELAMTETLASNLGKAATALLKAKPGAKHDALKKQLVAINNTFNEIPITKILEIDFALIKAREWLKRGNYSFSENEFNNAHAQLAALVPVLPVKQKGKKSKTELSAHHKALREYSESLQAGIDDYLLYIRREEPMPGALASKADKKIEDGMTKIFKVFSAGCK